MPRYLKTTLALFLELQVSQFSKKLIWCHDLSEKDVSFEILHPPLAS